MLNNSEKYALWFFKKDLENQSIKQFEQNISSELSFNKSKEYSYSRGYARLALSNLFQVDPLDIPLYSFPGTQPILKKGWGYLSISHCKDAIVIAWSSKRIGVDIERADREFSYKKICERFFTSKEKLFFSNLNLNKQRKFVLNHWIMKEAAFKWQKEQLPHDLFGWEWDKDSNICFQERLSQKLKFSLINYDSWTIGIATCFFEEFSLPVICIN